VSKPSAIRSIVARIRGWSTNRSSPSPSPARYWLTAAWETPSRSAHDRNRSYRASVSWSAPLNWCDADADDDHSEVRDADAADPGDETAIAEPREQENDSRYDCCDRHGGRVRMFFEADDDDDDEAFEDDDRMDDEDDEEFDDDDFEDDDDDDDDDFDDDDDDDDFFDDDDDDDDDDAGEEVLDDDDD